MFLEYLQMQNGKTFVKILENITAYIHTYMYTTFYVCMEENVNRKRIKLIYNVITLE